MGKQLQLQVAERLFFFKNFCEPQNVKNEMYEGYLNRHNMSFLKCTLTSVMIEDRLPNINILSTTLVLNILVNMVLDYCLSPVCEM
jgi:hypothetical protein